MYVCSIITFATNVLFLLVLHLTIFSGLASRYSSNGLIIVYVPHRLKFETHRNTLEQIEIITCSTKTERTCDIDKLISTWIQNNRLFWFPIVDFMLYLIKIFTRERYVLGVSDHLSGWEEWWIYSIWMGKPRAHCNFVKTFFVRKR